MHPLFYLVSCYLLACSIPLGRPGVPAGQGRAPAPQAGLQTDDSFSVEDLVQDVFVTGACNTITNIRAIGDKKGIGYFENGQSSIGMSRGVILSTGPVGNAEGPNAVTDKSGDFMDNSGDPDLDIMATGDVKDAVGIEFDFMPLDSIVTFTYVFASEEYCEFVGSIYNDVFGFFIRGPGIQGGFSHNAANVALLPGSNDFVSINSVNHQQNEAYYVRNELADDALACGQGLYFDNYYEQIEFDGFTRRLTAVLRLQPCETYHIRLVVADVGDNFYDSAVFLAAESFNLGGKVEISAATGAGPDAPSREGCQDAYFLFERAPGSNLQFPLAVNYKVSALSTALPGADYEALPGYATIPSGQPSVKVPVYLFNDGQAETVEDIVLELDIPCACFTDTARMYIADSPPVFARLDDFGLCENGSAEISPAIEGGAPPYTYQWNTGETSASINATAQGPPAYAVSVYDACGNSAADSAVFFLAEPPEGMLSGQASVCEGDTAFLSLQLSGTAPWRVVFSVDGVVQPPAANIFSSSYSLPATLPGAYELLEVSDAACEGYAGGMATVEVRAITLEVESRNVSCPDRRDGSILAMITGGTPPFDYYWLENIGAGLAPEGLPAGAYHLVVTDSSGCRKEVAVEIGSPPPLEAARPDCDKMAEGQVAVSASGGTPPYLYSVDGESFYGPYLLNLLDPGQEYSLTVQDAAGCQLEHPFIMPAAYEQMATLPASIEAPLGRRILLQPRLNIPSSLLDNIRWAPPDNLSCTDCLEPELLPLEDATYTIHIADIYGCSGEASVKIKIGHTAAIFMPTAFSPNGDNANDRFTVYANTFQVKRVASLSIFDRWGGMAFRREDFPPNEEAYGWDGAARGQPLDPGLYTYMVEVILINGERQTAAGQVTLLR